jgi:very-short-patch-repair endonuclease
MAEWSRYARAQDGVISRRQLLDSGVSPTSIKRLVANGALDRIAPAIALVRGAPLTYRARLWCAVLSTDGALGYQTAGELWGFVSTSSADVHVVLPHARRVYPPDWVRVHRASRDFRAIVVQAGLPITDRHWTLFDLLPGLPRSDASALTDRAIQRGWLSSDAVSRHLKRFPRRRGNAALRRLATQLGDGAAADSERLLHRILRTADVHGWVANYPIWVDGELAGVADVAIPERKIVLEVDGWAHHSDVARFRRDRTKQNALVAHGWTVLRFTWADLTERPGYVSRTILSVLAA